MQPAGYRNYTYTDFVSTLENNYQYRDVPQIPALMFGGFCRRLCLKAMRIFKEEEVDFLNCVLQVDLTDERWEKSLRKIRLDCRAVRQWNVHQNGRVEISAYAKPNNLMRRIRKSTAIKLISMHAGQCSTNLFLREAPAGQCSSNLNLREAPKPSPKPSPEPSPEPSPKPSQPRTSNRPQYQPQPPRPQQPPLVCRDIYCRGYGHTPLHPPSEPCGYGYGYRPPQSRFVFGEGQSMTSGMSSFVFGQLSRYC